METFIAIRWSQREHNLLWIPKTPASLRFYPHTTSEHIHESVGEATLQIPWVTYEDLSRVSLLCVRNTLQSLGHTVHFERSNDIFTLSTFNTSTTFSPSPKIGDDTSILDVSLFAIADTCWVAKFRKRLYFCWKRGAISGEILENTQKMTQWIAPRGVLFIYIS